MIRVLVVEDQQALADALEIAIGAQPDLDCVGAVGTVEAAIPMAEAHRPDVVLMDIHLPGADGIEGTRRVKALRPDARVLILTGDATPDFLAAASGAGAAGFLAKDSSFPDILDAIRSPMDDKVIVEGETLKVLFAAFRPVPVSAGGNRLPGGAIRPRLTVRELEVLGLMGEGLDPRAIAEHLIVSPHTARGHVKNIMTKLGAHSQLEAVIVATRSGLLSGPQIPGQKPRNSPYGGVHRPT
ncbi:response regulator [Sphaerisporangium sp. NPDC049003]|uniref:response regulator transcription factor n=1 Tax=Sphaerisporangium sp. NPDC049003 TaxID=3364517 RepID=UPI00371AF782